jgi:hypothetical protein
MIFANGVQKRGLPTSAPFESPTDSVDYVQENPLKGMTCERLGLQNQYLTDWEKSVADTHAKNSFL